MRYRRENIEAKKRNRIVEEATRREIYLKIKTLKIVIDEDRTIKVVCSDSIMPFPYLQYSTVRYSRASTHAILSESIINEWTRFYLPYQNSYNSSTCDIRFRDIYSTAVAYTIRLWCIEWQRFDP